MKQYLFLAFSLFAARVVFGQTGNLTTDIDFVRDAECVTYHVKLEKSDTTLTFSGVRSGDTLKNIPIGLYQATFYSCDSAIHYGQKIEILSDELRYINYRNNAYVGNKSKNPFEYSEEYYFDYYDSLWTPVYFAASWQFSRGMDFDGTHPNLLNNFAFDYIVGHDWLVANPLALGYELGFGFTQANFSPQDLDDPLISHDKQRFTTFDVNFGFVTSIYVNERRMLTLGARYRLPYFARYARINGNDKLSTRGLHKYNDFSVFAQLGYNWGFVFAEYRFEDYLRDPVGSMPSLSLGVRLGFRDEF
ncbi:MAG: hypothetical protein ACFHU9_04635 [Fluviicola sp.]